MKKLLPILLAVFIVLSVAFFVIIKKNEKEEIVEINPIGTFEKQKSCSRLPYFLKSLKVQQPVLIDLSQKQFKGIALRSGKTLNKIMHPKQWEQYGFLGTYTLDKQGNIYLAPMPYISIEPTTFNLQKNIYKVDSNTGKLSIFMHLDEVHPTPNNPYGINALTYDCDDGTLWVSAIDESDYQQEKGVIYHIDIKHKKIIQTVKGFDALTLTVVKSKKGKFLLAGSARDNGLYAYTIKDLRLNSSPVKILSLPNSTEHIRKIKIFEKNRLMLQVIPFSYTLIAQTDISDRILYSVFWNVTYKKWEINKKNN